MASGRGMVRVLRRSVSVWCVGACRRSTLLAQNAVRRRSVLAQVLAEDALFVAAARVRYRAVMCDQPPRAEVPESTQYRDEALSYCCTRPSATALCGLQPLLYAAVSYCSMTRTHTHTHTHTHT